MKILKRKQYARWKAFWTWIGIAGPLVCAITCATALIAIKNVVGVLIALVCVVLTCISNSALDRFEANNDPESESLEGFMQQHGYSNEEIWEARKELWEVLHEKDTH